jgi:uncharacterized protein (TIGR03437 family)
MSFRRGVLRAAVCLLALASFAPAQNQYIAFHSGAGNSSTELYVFLAGLLQPVAQLRNVSGGTFQILPLPDGTKYYLIANGGAAVTAVDGSFTNPRTVASSFSAAPTFAALQPDGRRLILCAGRVYFLETGTDTVANPNGLVVSGEPIDVVVNFDSTRAFVLSRTSTAGPAATVLTVIDLVNGFARLAELTFPGNQTEQATGLVLGPNGNIYLSAYARIYEINADTMRLTNGGELSVRGYPNRGTLTPDGRYLIFPNRQPIFGGNSIIQLDLSNRTFSYDGASTSEVFARFTPSTLDSSPTRMYAYGNSGRLYDLTLGSQVILDRSQLVQRFQTGIENVIFPNLAFSNEIPPRTLWYTRPITNLDGSTSRRLVQAGLTSFDQNIQEQNLQFTQNLEMTFLSPGVTSGGTRILGFNTTQTTTGGQRTGLPLVSRLVDSLGRGIYRGQITFASANPAVVVQNPQVVTGVDGWAQTFVTVPNVPGTYTVVATGGQNVTPTEYTITVPGVAGPGGTVSQGGIYVVDGNGQLNREGFGLAAPLIVQLLDANGIALSGQKVVWTLIRGTGNLGTVETTTGTDGRTQLSYTTGRVPVPLAAAQDVIEAASTFGKVTFYLTTIALNLPSGQFLAGDAQIEYIYPNLGDLNNRNLTIEAGTILKNAIGIRVADYLGQPLENVSLGVTTKAPPIFTVDGFAPPAPAEGFEASCDATPLSDARGNVVCDIKAGNRPGTGALYVIVGSYRAMPTLNLTVTVGRANRLRVLAGDNQKAKGNTSLPVPLQVQVTDLGGNPIANSPVTWSIVAPGTGTLGAARTLSNTGGIAQNTFRTGIVPGKLQVRAQIDNPVAGGTPIFVVFNIETETTLGGLVQVSGNGQETGIGNDFPNPLVVQVNDVSGQPLPGVRVEFAAIGSGVVVTSSEVTNQLGQAATRIRAGSSSGPVTVTATTGTFTTSFNLTVRPPTPTVLGSNIVNSASLQPGLTPCGLATITGTNLLPGVQGLLQPNSIGQLPTTLGPVNGIQIAGISAPIVRVVNSGGREQVDIQTPCEVPTGSQSVTINVQGQSSLTVQGVQVSQYQPGIFEFDATDGRRYAVAIKEDGSFVGPTNPAERGKTVRVLMTGLGQTNPALATNRAGVANQTVTASLIGGINDAGVRVVRADTVQGQIGNYLVEIEVPADTQAGPYQSLAVAVSLPGGQLVFSNGAFIPIR